MQKSISIKADKLEQVFQLILRSIKRPIDAEAFRQKFSEINKRAYEIANREVYKIYSTATTSKLDFTIGKYFINPTWTNLTLEEIQFLLTHPLATPDLYIFKESNPHIETHQKRCFIIRRSLLVDYTSLLKTFKSLQKKSLCISPEIFKFQLQDVNTFTFFKMRSVVMDIFHRQDYSLLNLISQSTLKLDFLKSDNIAITNLEKNSGFYDNIPPIFTSDFSDPFIKITELDDVELLNFLIKNQPDLKIFKEKLSATRFIIDEAEFSFSEFTVWQRAHKVIEKLKELNFDMTNVNLQNVLSKQDLNKANTVYKNYGHHFFPKLQLNRNVEQVEEFVSVNLQKSAI